MTIAARTGLVLTSALFVAAAQASAQETVPALPFPDRNTYRHQQRAQKKRAGKEA